MRNPCSTGVPALLRERLGLQRLELRLRDRAGVEQLLGLRDLGGGPAARRVAHIVVELLPLRLHLFDAALPHPIVLDDQIDQHPQPRQDHHEDHPRRLRPATDVAAAENVHQHGDHDPDPDHPEKEDDHRPQHVHERIVSRYHHLRAFPLDRLRVQGAYSSIEQTTTMDITADPRSRAQRRRDTEHRLSHDIDVWVATASADGAPYLVPLSFDWDGEALLVATPADSPTGRNLAATRAARLALGHTRDVVTIDGEVEVFEIDALPHEQGDRFAARSGFDP